MQALPEAGADLITGRGEVIDGDSLRVNGVEMRLQGVDAFEYGQRCGTFACGDAAKAHMRQLLASGTARCEPLGEDRYERVLVYCVVNGRDIGESLVQAGLAVAYRRYSQRYVADEAAAKAAKRGAWAYGFEAPEDFRHAN